MTDRDALLAAVRAAPDDDLPRLVYADWLDENADALPPAERASAADRAAVIRAQVEAARAEPFSPAAREADARAEKLFTQDNCNTWTGNLPGELRSVEFVRGFVGNVGFEADRFDAVADVVFDAEPVRALRLLSTSRVPADEFGPFQFRETLESVFAVSRLRHLSRLELDFHLLSNSVEFDALAGSPHLEGLTELSLQGNPVPPPWLTAFLAGDRLPHLTALDLSAVSNLGPALAAGLRRAGHRRFTRLDLSEVAFRSDALKAVLESPGLAGVEDLRLRWGGVWGGAGDGPLVHLNLGWVVPWDRLRVLDLGGQGIGPEGVREITENPAAKALRWLGLARNGLGAEGAALLAAAPHLHLYHLDVRQNGLGPKDAEALRRRFPEAVVEV